MYWSLNQIKGNLYLIAIYGLKAIKHKQTLGQPTGNCKTLNSYLYICGWFLYIWGWLRASFSPLWSISFIHWLVPCLYKYGQLSHIWGWFIQCDWFLYIWGKLYTFVEFYTFEGPTDNMTPKYLLPINWIDVLTIQLLFNFTLKLPAHTFDKQSFSLFSPSHGYENISLKYVRIRGLLRLRSKPNLDLSVEQACSLLNGSTYHCKLPGRFT